MNLSYIVIDENGDFLELPIEQIEEGKPRIAIVNVEGDLYFAAIEDLQKGVEQILQTDIEVLVLRFRRTHLLASTGILALERLIKSARDKGVGVIFCGVHEEVSEPLAHAGIIEMVGESHIFLADNKIFDSTQKALSKARSLLELKEK